MLHITLVTVGVDLDSVGRKTPKQCLALVGLSACTVFFQERQTCVQDVIAPFPKPTVLQIILFYLRIVLKSIAIAIVMAPIVFYVRQYFGAQILIAVDV